MNPGQRDKIKSYNIFYDSTLNCVIMHWSGYATSQEFKEGTELMLQTLVANKASRVLADIKDMAIIGMDDQRWLETNFIPRAIMAGFTALAIVKPDYYFNKVAVESVSYKISRDKLMVNFFDSADEAKNWLRNL